MRITSSRTREEFPLSPRKIIKKTLGQTIGLLVGFSLLITAFFIFSSSVSNVKDFSYLIFLIFFILFITFVSLSYLYQRWYFAVYFYDFTSDYIVIKKGPITPHEITIPYERIQDVYVDQDIFDRIFGLYDVHLSSATISSGMEAHIDGVEKKAAEGLRAVLLKTVQERISRAKTK